MAIILKNFNDEKLAISKKFLERNMQIRGV